MVDFQFFCSDFELKLFKYYHHYWIYKFWLLNIFFDDTLLTCRSSPNPRMTARPGKSYKSTHSTVWFDADVSKDATIWTEIKHSGTMTANMILTSWNGNCYWWLARGCLFFGKNLRWFQHMYIGHGHLI